MNGYLPDDISILSCEDVPESFHARFSCVAKEYVYRIHNSESKNPFQTDLALHYRRAMQIDLMQEAANHLLEPMILEAFVQIAQKIRIQYEQFINLT